MATPRKPSDYFQDYRMRLRAAEAKEQKKENKMLR